MPTIARERPLSLTTPLGKDVLLLTALAGREGISSLFSFELDLVAPNAQAVPFEQLVGQPFTVALGGPDTATRYFAGICSRFSAGGRAAGLTSYRAEVVPWLWLLTRRAGSRIFQQKAVPDILRQVLQGGSVAFELQRTYPPREYCVQYRESDFEFASRLMEEEGIFYFFRHTAEGHQLVVADGPESYPALPPALFDASGKKEPRVFEWQKTQELRSGRVTLWDHNFELPHANLEAQSLMQDAVQAGSVTHRLLLAANAQLEVYDYPGGYAKRFDGIGPGGEQEIVAEGQRAARVRMEEDEIGLSLHVDGASTCRSFTSGHRFALQGHPDGDGDYVLTSVQHTARLTGDVKSPGPKDLDYSNAFTCVPAGLRFRPPRRTPRPVVAGPQTAIVVGPAGEEIFTDKYGRVKVQFHWDREGKSDQNSSCWVRVGALNAAPQGPPSAASIPRIGWEVVVAFLEGDPDQPIIVGSVWNPEHLPPVEQG